MKVGNVPIMSGSILSQHIPSKIKIKCLHLDNMQICYLFIAILIISPLCMPKCIKNNNGISVIYDP